MANRRLPLLVATRVDARERALIDAAAELEGLTTTQLVRRILLPAVAERVSRAAGELVRQGCASA